MTDTEIQRGAATVAHRACAMVHGIATQIAEQAAEPRTLTREQRDKLAGVLLILHAAHAELGEAAQLLHPGEFIKLG